MHLTLHNDIPTTAGFSISHYHITDHIIPIIYYLHLILKISCEAVGGYSPCHLQLQRMNFSPYPHTAVFSFDPSNSPAGVDIIWG
jgi:hypothetical protein